MTRPDKQGSHWMPSDECQRVLVQIGYQHRDIQHCAIEYAGLVSEFPGLIEANDNAFVTHLNACHPRRAERVKRSLSCHSHWDLSDPQKNQLEQEGYWPEILASVLLSFKIDELDKRQIFESRFAVFRSYLHRSVPLPTEARVTQWTPSPTLRRFLHETLSIPPRTYPLFWSHFERSFEKRGAQEHLKPRFLFNYLKANHSRILSRLHCTARS